MDSKRVREEVKLVEEPTELHACKHASQLPHLQLPNPGPSELPSLKQQAARRAATALAAANAATAPRGAAEAGAAAEFQDSRVGLGGWKTRQQYPLPPLAGATSSSPHHGQL
eukprot:1152386-Pelagomonas_calceolata.AAC.2